ncbi:MAG: LytTR family DNA-binding domain-containing protein [Bacteroidota bacterium]
MQHSIENKVTITGHRITVADLKTINYFSTGQIIRLEASDNYTLIHFEDRKPFLVSKVLKTYEDLLKPYGFVRTHRSHIINTHYIKSVTHDRIVMSDAFVAGLSRRKKNSVIKELGSAYDKLSQIA